MRVSAKMAHSGGLDGMRHRVGFVLEERLPYGAPSGRRVDFPYLNTSLGPEKCRRIAFCMNNVPSSAAIRTVPAHPSGGSSTLLDLRIE